MTVGKYVNRHKLFWKTNGQWTYETPDEFGECILPKYLLSKRIKYLKDVDYVIFLLYISNYWYIVVYLVILFRIQQI